MIAPAPVARVLERIAAGEAVESACLAEAVAISRDVQVDAHYDGKPVCTVTLPWVINGHALLVADDSVAHSVAEARLASFAASLAMPVCVVRRST